MIRAEILSPWQAPYPLLTEVFANISCEDISGQAANFQVTPDPNICLFAVIMEDATLPLIQADGRFEVVDYESL